jgi:serine/threonine protein kinase/WD40 repeat protein
MPSLTWVGKTIGHRYQIDALLGQGGMSAVYRAIDPNLRRTVAIKLIHPHLSTDPNFVHRFKEEAAAVARLRHPNIVQVHDFDVDDETYYMVMEHLAGETLQARLERLNATGRLMPFDEAIHLCSQLCDALGYAHDHDLVHRDIKPANVMLDLNNQAILMDFGIVKIVGGDTHTATGATVGTAMYMSPEQIRSERTDERSDIYSLGVTLYEMLSGRPPFQADSALPLMMMVLNDPLPDLREIRKGAPKSLLAVVEKALAKEKGGRFQTMGEMAAALGQVSPEEIHTTPAATVVDDQGPASAVTDTASPVEEPAKPGPAPAGEEGQASPGPPGLSAVPTLVDPRPPPLTDPASIQAPAPAAQAARPARPRRRLLWAAAVALLLVIAAAGIMVVTSRQAPNVELAPVDRPPEPITAQTANFVVSLAGWGTGSFVEDLAISPGGDLVATANNRETLPFSRYRFYGGLWRVESGALATYLLGHSRWVYGVAFSGDGRFLATAGDDGRLILWEASGGGMVREIETSLGGMASVAFSPNNLLLAAGSWNGVVGLWQIEDGQLLRALEGHGDGARDVAFSPDGTLLASASEDATLKIWSVKDGSLVHTLRGHTGPVREAAFSPDGELLASASNDRSIGLWAVKDGDQVRTLQGHSDPVLGVAFSPDGSLLASGSGDETVRLWRVSDGELLTILGDQVDAITGLTFSADGRLLITASASGALRFWGLSEAISSKTATPRP